MQDYGKTDSNNSIHSRLARFKSLSQFSTTYDSRSRHLPIQIRKTNHKTWRFCQLAVAALVETMATIQPNKNKNKIHVSCQPLSFLDAIILVGFFALVVAFFFRVLSVWKGKITKLERSSSKKKQQNRYQSFSNHNTQWAFFEQRPTVSWGAHATTVTVPGGNDN